MERLEYGEKSPYVALKATVHMVRYLTARRLCPGRAVLDVACGEGYGSWLMAQWGAQSVLGVDASNDAVDKAKDRFASDSVHFATGFGESLPTIVSGQQFDLIISLDTIEHVENPELFLKNIQAVAAPGATIIISASNDYRDYAHGGGNKLHRHRFKLGEFQSLTEKILGKSKSWNFGTLGVGFSLIKQDEALKSGNFETPQDLMLDFRNIDAAMYAPSQFESDPTSTELAFYVGVWGADEISETIFAGYPVSMHLAKHIPFPRNVIKRDPSDPLREAETRTLNSEEELESLKDELEALSEKLSHSGKEVERLRMVSRAAKAEVNAAKAEVNAAKAEVNVAWDTIQQVPWEIVRTWWVVRRVIPTPVLRMIDRVRNSLRRSHAD